MLRVKSKRRIFAAIILTGVVFYLSLKVTQHKTEKDVAATVERFGGRVAWDADWFSWMTGINARLWWNINVVDFSYQSLTDEQFDMLAPKLYKLPNLKYLLLQGTQLTDDSLPHLQRFSHLEHVTIGNTSISDTSPHKLEALNFSIAE